ncbi:Vacuolar protein sorting-associated protein 13 [Marasmius crinis-equi]|uniref:Vacuolar protein sorting-associated protein 13 n=1 Tax=Marasmius crinis-equi TaxID=585013 RepID=A0ABR3G1C3_9AGAR
MWWLDPGKEVLNVVFNRILAPYVENLDMNQVNYGIGQGQLGLRQLRLKKGALDKFRLPVDVIEGHLGKFELSLHWMNLGNQPVEILIEDVSLLVVPSMQSKYDPEEEERRALAAKLERVENAELLHMRGQPEKNADESPQQQGLITSLIAKIINNLQITVKNIHIRYEDKLSVPGLGQLQSLAVYFDTDATSLAGLSPAEVIKKFNSMIAHDAKDSDHQFILKPVSGEGRIIMNNKFDNKTPRFDVELLFDEIGVALDDSQYRDVISLLDMYHVYIRKHQVCNTSASSSSSACLTLLSLKYRKFLPNEKEFNNNKAQARLKFVCTAILESVRERRRRWTWDYFAERRDDRLRYIELFQKKTLGVIAGEDTVGLQDLEKKLSYEDIRFYRSIARSRLRKDEALRKSLEQEKAKQQQQKQSWSSWIWGSSDNSSKDDPGFGGSMTEEQRQQLYDVLDYDEKMAVADSFQTPADFMKARIKANLKRGSFTLKNDPHRELADIIAVNFDAFQANVIQRPDNLEASLSLVGFSVFDGTTEQSVHRQIVKVKDLAISQSASSLEEPFLFVKFENKPLDERADNALTVKMRHMEIVYHKGYVEAVYKFLKPPASQIESVEALLTAASETLEGLSKETRAGLEFALQNHKTIDIQMDMNAPIIIVPEDITTTKCKHLIIDAGHIAIESELADKNAIRSLRQKKDQTYSRDADQHLQSLLYDKFSLKLEAAQFVVGNDLQSCLDALSSAHDSHNMHLLERININLLVQNSIVPSFAQLARFKVSGNLPSLQVNLSDNKYKALMRLIDVGIPKFGDDTPAPTTNIPDFPLGPARLFPQIDTEYHMEDDEEPSTSKSETFYDADGSPENPELRQHIFEFAFQVERLGASLSKSGNDGTERPLGNVSFERFDLNFVLAKFDMKVDVNLRSLSMDIEQPGKGPMKFISSSETADTEELLSVGYVRVQKESPEFLTTYEGIDQSVDVKISTLRFHAAPEPVVSLYDFIMTTFVPPSTPAVQQEKTVAEDSPAPPTSQSANNSGKIKVGVELASVQVTLINEAIQLATLSLSTANVAVLVLPTGLQVAARLGSLSLSNDSDEHPVLDEFNQILSIEGRNFADFSYENFNKPREDGIQTIVQLNAGSLKMHYLERPLHDLYVFLAKLARLKGLYDTATQVAVQTASGVDVARLHFSISIKSPIVIFPSDPAHSRDMLTTRLGEITARNTCEGRVSRIDASLRGVQLTSTLFHDEESSVMKVIDDIDLQSKITQTAGIDRSTDLDFPDTQVSIDISAIRLHLTQVQYGLLMQLLQSIPRVLEGAPTGTAQAESATIEPTSRASSTGVSQALAAGSGNNKRAWTTLDLVVSMETVKLHLYDEQTFRESDTKDHGIAKFALNHSSLRFKMLSDGAQEAQVVLKSFTMNNTRPGASKFREIIPAAKHDRNQFMILYTRPGGPQGTPQAILSIDTPQIIFAVHPVFGLLKFFTSGVTTQTPEQSEDSAVQAETTQEAPASSFDFRLELHDISISVLEDDSDPDSQSIKLGIKRVLLSQQGVMALTVDRLGMSLMRMGKPEDSARFLDDFDLTFTLDNRSSSSQNMSSIELNAKPVVFRASYRDINLITAIVNKAIELYTTSQDNPQEQITSEEGTGAMTVFAQTTQSGKPSHPRPAGKARTVTSKEQLKASVDGFRLVLIGDMHEQPMLHLKVKPFIIGAKDWSGELSATTTLATQISYWNLTNSHWEPLIDPWRFSITVSRQTPTSELGVKLEARDRLDLNLSTTFAELAMTTWNMWSKEGEHILQNARGSYAPYRIRNRTGSPVFIWTDDDNNNLLDSDGGVQIANEQTIDWRFDDWRTMREHVPTSGDHNIGIRFVGKTWDHLRSVPVDREGEFVFPLRPRTDKHSNRLLCEVRVVDNVKVVTIRSTFKVENLTLYPIEITLVDDHGHPVYSLEKVAPGQDYTVPIEAVNQTKLRIQPDQGFGYKWCGAIRWEDIVARQSFTVKCPHGDPREAAFRFQAWVQSDITANDSLLRKYPKINLKLRAPLELENLLPYNLQYRVYDKDTDQNWKSYLRQGGVMPVHSVELGHLVLLNVEVQDTVFKPSDFAIINTDGSSDFDVESRLVLRDGNGRKLNLRLNYVRYPDSGGAFKVQIYSPYVVVNKTGLPFYIRTRSNRAAALQDVAGDNRTEVLSSPTPFMLSHISDQGREFAMRFADSSWSRPVSLETPSAETTLIVPSQRQRSDEIHVALSWTEGLGKYKLTKVITFTPRFLLKNNLSEPISFRQHGVAPRERSVINPGERAPLQLLNGNSEEKLLTLAFPGLNAQWSPPINLADIGLVYLRLRRAGENSASITLVRADVQIDGSTVFIQFTSADDEWPFVIENRSDYAFSICQNDATREEHNRPSASHPLYQVKAHSTLSYAWDYPAAKDKKIALLFNDSRRMVDVMEIGSLVPFKFRDGQRVRAVSLDVRADGRRQVLSITNYSIERSPYKPKARGTSGSLARQDTMSSAVETFEAVTEEVTPSFAFSVDFAGIGISLVNRKLVEVIYLSANKLVFEYSSSATAQSFNLSCGLLQIDNQLHEALYSVVLQPTPISRDSKTVAALPTIQASIILLNDDAHGVLFVKYCSILLQALTIEADEDLLFAIYDLTQIKGASWEESTKDVLIEYPEEIPEPRTTTVGQNIYFEVLELQPIKLSLSFMRADRVSSDEKLSIRNPLAVVVNALTMALGNVNDAPLEFNALAIKDIRLTTLELQSRMMYHYRQEVIRQLYRVLGSADFIGNPVGLFTNVSSGVADIFYEPFNGVIMHGNSELGIGIAKGAASFVKKTVFGLSDSMTKFTSSVGKGLSSATFDAEYQARRRMNQRRNRPKHAIYGVTAGGEAFANSMASAMEGVLMKPIEGAESEGALGFFKGMGKGLVGAATKPVVGVFDLVSNVSEGIRNTTTVFDNPDRDRVRLPRLVPHDNVLKPYSAREALGQYWMRDLKETSYRQESYVAHINTPGSDNIVLLTMTRVISFWSKKLRLDWELPLTQVQGVTVEDTGIRFAHKSGSAHDKFVFIPDKNSQSWFFEQVAGVVKAFNIRRRMDT